MQPPALGQPRHLDLALHTLGWVAFQEFSGILISNAFAQPVETFSPTHDGGRDGGFRILRDSEANGLVAGCTVIQCKHSERAEASLSLAILSEEISKAERLALLGRAANYILVTNMRLTGTAHEAIQNAFLKIPGIKTFHCFGREWITTEFEKSPELRRFVPRVYGLGDLGSILDNRIYEQTRIIFNTLKEEVKTFVVTDAYRKAVKALDRHGLVLLLGDPGSGKSCIAATHSIASADLERRPTLKIRNAEEFRAHWDPNEPNQFFWIDDAFGATQFDQSLAQGWASVLPDVRAAIALGAHFLFTSRTYIFREAETFLKPGELPQLLNSQVTIELRELTSRERQQIVYNHLRLGTQPREFKTAVKYILERLVGTNVLLPETARRLADPFFTRALNLTDAGVRDFFERPVEYLDETICKLDADSRKSLYVLFMYGGTLASPLASVASILDSIEPLGLDIATLAEKLRALNGTLTAYNEEGFWGFKHPTVRDAISRIVGREPELIDIYLRGTPVEKAVAEIRCPNIEVEGSNVILPLGRFSDFAGRLNELGTSRIIAFTLRRANANFRRVFFTKFPDSLAEVVKVAMADPDSSAGELLCTLYENGVLSEAVRDRFVAALMDACINEVSASLITKERFDKALSAPEKQMFAARLKSEVIPSLDVFIESRCIDFDPNNDNPDEFFDDLAEALEEFKALYELGDDVLALIDATFDEINEAQERLWEEVPPEPDDDDRRGGWGGPSESGRGFFDDVDA